MRTASIVYFAFLLLQSCSYLPELPELDGVDIIEKREYILIEPESGTPGNTGLLFYPGGLVDPHAYIALMAQFAKSGNGHTAVIVKEPGNLAVFNADKGLQVIKDIAYVDDWVIAGHSLGGTMACTAVKKEKNVFKGLILLAAYPAGNTNISGLFIPVLSLVGDRDGLVSQSDIDNAAPLLPKRIDITDVNAIIQYPGATYYYTIEGGIHAYFGDYGMQNGDGNPTITREEQQALAIMFIEKFFEVNNLN
ncbi:MAG: alpha/beta hydrolase [Chitinophagales bacterium]